jgi:hypothetical protein
VSGRVLTLELPDRGGVQDTGFNILVRLDLARGHPLMIPSVSKDNNNRLPFRGSKELRETRARLQQGDLDHVAGEVRQGVQTFSNAGCWG